MWELIPNTGKTTGSRFVMDKEYIVGRKDCPILIKDDPSISRKHAAVSVSYNIADLVDPTKLPEVTVKDTSKYGVTVNGNKIESGSSCKLRNGDEVLFGTHNSSYRLSYTPAIFVASCLDSNKKKTLKRHIHKIGGHLLSEWRHGCTTHLVMDGLTFTVKVIHALANCCPVVTPEFVEEMIKAADGNLPMPEFSRFLPPVKEETIKSDGPKFLPDHRRKTLFSGKTFIFLSKKQYKRTYESVEGCGSKTMLLESADMLNDETKLVNDDLCVMMVDAKERESLPPDTKRLITLSMDILKKHKRRPIPESELGLAILQVSLDKYCNPSMDAVPLLTQNIVCQSLHLCPEEMSQVFSQHHENKTQFKKPVTSAKCQQSQSVKTEAKTSVMDTVLETQTHTQVTPVRKQAPNAKKETVAETQHESQSPLIPKRQQTTRVIPDSMTTSFGNEKSPKHSALVADTPLEETVCEKKITSRMETQTNVVVSGNEKSPKHSALVVDTPLDETVHEKKGTAKMENQRNVVSESEFDVSRSVVNAVVSDTLDESSCKKDVENKGHFAVPESMDVSASKKHIAENNGHFAVPDTMDIDNGTSSRGRSQRGSSSSSEASMAAASVWKSAKRMRSESDESDLKRDGRQPYKRARNQDLHGTAGDQEQGSFSNKYDDQSESFSRKRHHVQECSTDEHHEDGNARKRFQDGDKGANGLSHSRGNGIDEEEDTLQGDATSSGGHTSDGRPPVRSTRPVILPDGFLSARIPRKQVAKPPGGDEDEEDGFPRNLVVVDEVSLVVRQPRQHRQATQPSTTTSTNVKNFKKFRKQWYPGCSSAFPRIIGGSDLMVFENSSGVEQEDWFVEAREVDAEEDRLDRQAEQLFMMEPQGTKRRKR